MTQYKTHSCGELNISNKNENIILSGWVHKIRNKGKIIWIDLRDRYGITQIVIENGVCSEENFEIASSINREYVLRVEGIVQERENKNKNISTGEIEVLPIQIEILNKSETPPFTLEEETDGGPELLAKYRYLDLRRSYSQRDIILKNEVLKFVRKFLADKNFLDIETPNLVKSTPEGARDFIVPARQFEDQYYALPQSPQIFKQLLMMAGFDRYYQIAKCFRDEDLRSDRQPEFSQIDCELSFMNQGGIMNIFEEMIRELFKEVKKINLPNKFPMLTYEEAMLKYGSDKPDLRYGMEFSEATTMAKKSSFQDFIDAETVIGFVVKDFAKFSRKEIQNLEDYLQKENCDKKKIFTIKIDEEGEVHSSIAKFFSEENFRGFVNIFSYSKNDLIIILSGKRYETLESLGELRLKFCEKMSLEKEFAPLWVVDFPLFERDKNENRFVSKHHPFTMPKEEDLLFLEKNPEKVLAQSYDLVINGAEIGGGSIRICNEKIQKQVLNILGFSKERAEDSFGFLLEAIKYGAPPHGGIAFGIDRLCAVLEKKKTIRSFIAFPKNNSGRDVMMDAPGRILK